MQITNLVPFVCLMLLFVGMGFAFSRLLPLYRTLVPRILNQPGYFVELESLRGLLALAVVVHHAVVWYFLLYRHTPDISGPNATFYSQLGTAPVTLFFFTTSFLFWSKLIAAPKQRFSTFLNARLRRLGPAYLAAAVCMLVLVAFFTHFELHGTPGSVLRDGIRVLVAETPVLNGLATAPWLWGVTWTLRLEFLFYLVIPALGWFAQTWWKSLLFVAGCNLLYLGNTAILARHWFLPGFSQFQFLVDSLSSVFCVGILTAHLVRSQRIRAWARSSWAAPVALLLVAVTLFALPARQGKLESLALAIPFLAVASGCTFWGGLRSRGLLFLGQISYSVYLIHCLIYGALLLPLSGTVSGAALKDARVYWVAILVAGPVILSAATLWHRTLEYPFLRKRTVSEKVAPRRWVMFHKAGYVPVPK